MIRRLLPALNPQLLTVAIGGWLAGRAAAGTSPSRRVIAVGGKTLRGSGTTETAARHVMAACDQASSVVLADTDVDGKIVDRIEEIDGAVREAEVTPRRWTQRGTVIFLCDGFLRNHLRVRKWPSDVLYAR